jgi:hypothetical protein
MWEYTLLNTVRPQLETRLNELGALGWELVNFQYNPLNADVIAILKRPKTP